MQINNRETWNYVHGIREIQADNFSYQDENCPKEFLWMNLTDTMSRYNEL